VIGLDLRKKAPHQAGLQIHFIVSNDPVVRCQLVRSAPFGFNPRSAPARRVITSI